MNDAASLWRTLARQGAVGLLAGFGAGLASAFVLVLSVLMLSQG